MPFPFLAMLGTLGAKAAGSAGALAGNAIGQAGAAAATGGAKAALMNAGKGGLSFLGKMLMNQRGQQPQQQVMFLPPVMGGSQQMGMNQPLGHASRPGVQRGFY